MDGLCAGDSQSSRVKVIIASGFTHNEAIDQLKTQGISGFLPKPFKFGDLVSALETNIRKSRDSD